MCQGNDHLHEDFGDEPSVEERIPEGWNDFEEFDHVDDDGPDDLDDDDAQEDFADEDDDDDDEDFDDDDEDFDDDDELAQDRILERQELEDFEGFNPFENDVGGEGGEW